jgi:hypothetical protein
MFSFELTGNLMAATAHLKTARMGIMAGKELEWTSKASTARQFAGESSGLKKTAGSHSVENLRLLDSFMLLERPFIIFIEE